MMGRISLLLWTLSWCSLALFPGNLDLRLNSNRIENTPVIDGQIDLCYGHFATLTDFYQYEPQSGPPGSEKTVFYIGHDSEHLYIAFRCYDQQKSIYSRLGKREDIDNSDEVMLYLDTFNTRQRAFFFGATPLGIQMDGTRDDESQHNRKDFSWDGHWYSAGKLYEWGYFVEMKIPFATLRFPSEKAVQEWGMVAVRRIARKGEAMLTVKMDRSTRGFLTQASTLVIDGQLKNGKKLAMIPTTLLSDSDQSKLQPSPGISLKYSFNSSMVADLAVNPDFSQIESDAGQIDINQRYALEYPEKRPFFLESKALYETPLSLFYSRRIADPDWGIKFSGQFGRSGIGILSAYDRASFENLDDVTQGGEQNAWVNMLRYRYQLGEANHLGFFISHKKWNEKNNLVISADSNYVYKNMAIRFQGALSNDHHHHGNALDTSISYDTRPFNLMMGYKQISPDFNAQLGFIRRVSYRTYYLFGGTTFYPEKEYLRSYGIRGMFTQNFDWLDGRMTEMEGSLSLQINTFKNSYFEVGVRKEKEEYAGILFDKTRFNLNLHVPLSRQIRLGGSLRLGDGINYDENDPYLGYACNYGLNGELSSFGRMITEVKYTGYHLYRGKNEPASLTMDIFRLSNTFLFNRWLASRLIYEYNSYYISSNLSLLLSYELNPGTGIHLGTAMTRYKIESEDLQNNWSVFLKLSYLLQI